MDLVAPSGDVNLDGDVRTIDREGNSGYETGNYTNRFGGTSAACPQISGVAALMLSVNPNLTETQVRTILQQTATDMGNTGFDNTFGYGRVDAEAAILEVIDQFTVAGPDVVCYSNNTFTASNSPTCSTIDWTTSTNLEVLSGDNTLTPTISAKYST